MTIGGSNTVHATIEWALSLLLNHPSSLAKAKVELDEHVGENRRLVEESDLPKLTYLKSIINETLRLYPPGPLLVPHYSSKDCNIGGFDVPSGTMVLVNAWAIHRDPKVWEDPLSFRPERFDNNASNNGDHHYKLIPFGAGRRACPGISLAYRIVGLALATLIQCFEWERTSEDQVDMREVSGLSMTKAVPLEAMCRPRKAMIRVFNELGFNV
ncbi:hypothetical protein QQ045_029508 [Rhodiola kirilowii]